jgi:hypothetical protein
MAPADHPQEEFRMAGPIWGVVRIRQSGLLVALIALVGLLAGCNSVTLQPPSDVTTTSVTLHASGNVDTHDYGQYWFEYSTDQQNWTQAPHHPFGTPGGSCDSQGNTTPVSVSEQINGLNPGTRYYWRLAALHCNGVQYVFDSHNSLYTRGQESGASWASFGTLGLNDSQLVNILNHPDTATAVAYGATDSAGNPLGDASVIQLYNSPYKYAAVYHARYGSNFHVNLGVSNDLIHWTYVRTLLTTNGFPRLFRPAGGGWIVLTSEFIFPYLGSPAPGTTDPPEQHTLQFNLFYDESDLLNGAIRQTYLMPRFGYNQCSNGTTRFDGTPSVYEAHINQNAVGRFVVDGTYGFHHESGNGDLEDATEITNLFDPDHTRPVPLTLSGYNDMLHRGLYLGGVGARGTIQTSSGRYNVQEGNLGPGNPCPAPGDPNPEDGPYPNWRISLYRYRESSLYPTGGGDVIPLNPQLPSGVGPGLGTPSTSVVDNPNGAGKVLFVEYFAFVPGWPLIYYAPVTP